MATAILTQARLRELLDYDPETGVFTWRATGKGRPAIGSQAGATDKGHGYRSICVEYGRHYAHRLAFLYVTGEWPQGMVDHINGRRDDNRWCNLRDASRLVNQQNMRRAVAGSASGLLGAHKKRGKWSSQIKVRGVLVKLGIFETADQAHAAYLAAKRQLHEGCTL
jgi:hypothetical protein